MCGRHGGKYMNSNTSNHPTMSRKFSHLAQPTISKKVATELGIDYALAKRLVDIYNAKLYVDHPSRVRAGSKSSQILLALSFTKLAHLADIVVDGEHNHCDLVNCILSAAGYTRAVGGDAVTLTLLESC